MAVIKCKPTSPGRRFVVKVVNPELHKGAPYRPLLESQDKNGGRNSMGRITQRHQGGGHKQKYRIVDFRRNDKDGIPATVERLEYDPNRTAFIALIKYRDGELAYILAPQRLKAGDQVVVGVNAYTETTDSPLGGTDNILTVDPAVEAEMIADVTAWRAGRDQAAVDAALAELRRAAVDGSNIMEPSIALAKAGGTTGEWSSTLRDVFGEFRAPTGVSAAVGKRVGELAEVAAYVKTIAGGPPKFLVAKPGLDGHSNGAEQIAVAARDSGMEVVYAGIRSTPEQIVAAVRDEDPDVIGVSILSGSHLSLVPDILRLMAADGLDAPLVVGGIIPEADRQWLLDAGVAAIYTPKDYQLAQIMRGVADLAVAHRNA
jgi:(2R)-ethylmalonyl-CoA mutase